MGAGVQNEYWYFVPGEAGGGLPAANTRGPDGGVFCVIGTKVGVDVFGRAVTAGCEVVAATVGVGVGLLTAALVGPVLVHPLINTVPNIRNVRTPIICQFFIILHHLNDHLLIVHHSLAFFWKKIYARFISIFCFKKRR